MPKIGLILLFLLLSMFVLNMFLERFEKGDMFPKYSLLRTDAYGNSILYETLKDLLPQNTQIKEESFFKFKNTHNALFYFSSVKNVSALLKSNDLKSNGSFFKNGNTLLIGFENQNMPFNRNYTSFTDEIETNSYDWIDQSFKDLKIIGPTKDSLEIGLSAENTHALKSKINKGWSGFDETFTPLLIDNRGVIVALKKNINDGQIILISTPYLLSNEFLFKNKELQLIQSLFLSPINKQIIFDQTHLGIIVVPSTMGLIIRYKLDKILFLFLFAFVLYVWRINVSYNKYKFIEDDSSAQKPVLNSLVTLLEKNIPTHQIIDQCIKELKQTNKANKNDPTRSKPLKTLNKYDQKRKKDVVSYYNHIVEILSIRKNK
ncbi:MAG: hypothetical protein COA79_02720 [Planctomycetota bacterium]|nr:MAG: hypothetical protein COA79_02720 [Planctomycetota bacterium]